VELADAGGVRARGAMQLHFTAIHAPIRTCTRLIRANTSTRERVYRALVDFVAHPSDRARGTDQEQTSRRPAQISPALLVHSERLGTRPRLLPQSLGPPGAAIHPMYLVEMTNL